MIPLGDSLKSRRFPFVNILIVLVNVAVFVKEISLPHPVVLEGFLMRWSVIPVQLLNDPWGQWFTVVSAMFLHGGWAHIIGNVMYLWIFGGNVEDRMGHLRYLIFYLLAGGAATLTQVFLHTNSHVPMLGASGAIAGVLGAYFVLYPKARVTTLIPLGFFTRIVEIPAIFFLGFWFLLQALQGVGSLAAQASSGGGGGVAWWAHSGGFVAGLVLVWFFKIGGQYTN